MFYWNSVAVSSVSELIGNLDPELTSGFYQKIVIIKKSESLIYQNKKAFKKKHFRTICRIRLRIYFEKSWSRSRVRSTDWLCIGKKLAVLRIRIYYYADPGSKNVHMDPDPKGKD